MHNVEIMNDTALPVKYEMPPQVRGYLFISNHRVGYTRIFFVIHIIIQTRIFFQI